MLLFVLLAGLLAPPSEQPAARSLAARVKLVGNAVFSTETLRQVVESDIACDPRHELEAVTRDVTRGTVAACRSLEDMAGTIESFYIANGYVLARAHASGDEVIAVEEGDPFRVGAVEIAETAPVKDELGNPPGQTPRSRSPPVSRSCASRCSRRSSACAVATAPPATSAPTSRRSSRFSLKRTPSGCASRSSASLARR